MEGKFSSHTPKCRARLFCQISQSQPARVSLCCITVCSVDIQHIFSGQRLVPNPFATYPCRNFTVLGLCSSLQLMVLQGPNYFARIAKHVWTCTFSQSQRVAQPLPLSHSMLAQGLENKPKEIPTPHHLGNQYCLKNWSDTCGCRHTEHEFIILVSSHIPFPLSFFL